jgi:hypothetical protein
MPEEEEPLICSTLRSPMPEEEEPLICSTSRTHFPVLSSFMTYHRGQRNDQPSRSRSRRYQRGNQNTQIEEEQTTQCPKEKVQKDKQRSTKHTCKTKDRVTRTQLKTVVNSAAPNG